MTACGCRAGAPRRSGRACWRSPCRRVSNSSSHRGRAAPTPQPAAGGPGGATRARRRGERGGSAAVHGARRGPGDRGGGRRDARKRPTLCERGAGGGVHRAGAPGTELGRAATARAAHQGGQPARAVAAGASRVGVLAQSGDCGDGTACMGRAAGRRRGRSSRWRGGLRGFSTRCGAMGACTSPPASASRHRSRRAGRRTGSTRRAKTDGAETRCARWCRVSTER